MNFILYPLKALILKFFSVAGIVAIDSNVEKLTPLAVEDFIQKHLFNNPKYSDPRKLNRYERKSFSQNGEDGIINEIFKRIGTSNRFFVEFGVGNGLENNTVFLLFQDWKGVWIEGNPKQVRFMKTKFASVIATEQLRLQQAFIDSETIESLFKRNEVPAEFDLLTIDIDGNDYWVWQAIKNYSPRVVVIEYNATFGPEAPWVMKYDPSHVWDKSCYFGASLKALEQLGIQKGYRLVGCNFAGVNAFFVREDLLSDAFLAPYTSENHFEPARYYLGASPSGHCPNFGQFERP
jgi:hypothetical protein